jgi:hypothetical protein
MKKNKESKIETALASFVSKKYLKQTQSTKDMNIFSKGNLGQINVGSNNQLKDQKTIRKQ